MCGCIAIVVQRFRQCKLLLDEEQWITVGGDVGGVVGDRNYNDSCGLLVYVSFSSSATKTQVETAAQTVLNLPVLTTGLWGDSKSSTKSVLSLASTFSSSCSLVIVPQANLISKVKQQGKSIQYHGQRDKQSGEKLYDYFCHCIQGILLETQCEARSQDLPEWYNKRKAFLDQQNNKSLSPSPATPPEELFRDYVKYSEWDERGIPTKDSVGKELTKSNTKKLNKIYEGQMKKHIKWKEEQHEVGNVDVPTSEECVHPSSTVVAAETPPMEEQWDRCLDETFCHFVKGSFGKRQGLDFYSDMGPFVHSFQV